MHAPDLGGKPNEVVLHLGFPPHPINQTLEWSQAGSKTAMLLGIKLHCGQLELTANAV